MVSTKRCLQASGLLVLGVLSLGACSTAGGPACDPSAPAAAAYQLGAGDQLRLTVYRQPELSGPFAIDGQGNFAVPLVGEIRAHGLSTREIEAQIRTRLMEGGYLVDPQVGVEVLTHRSIYVMGEVNRPGQYEYQSGMNVINAVALAGGYTYRANSKEVSIRRAGCTMAAGAVTQVGPGEIITVQERFF